MEQGNEAGASTDAQDAVSVGADAAARVQLSDLEMTRLCALAIGLHSLLSYPPKVLPIPCNDGQGTTIEYDPLHDDAQAMALVKKMRLSINDPSVSTNDTDWSVDGPGCVEGVSADLNRAIVECVARIQSARATGR